MQERSQVEPEDENPQRTAARTQWEQAAPRTRRSPRQRRWNLAALAVITASALTIGIVALTSHQSPPAPAAKTTSTASSTQTLPALAPAAARTKAAAILDANVAHYADEFTQSQTIIGHTQYADANAGLAAMNDPASAAARFSRWRQGANPFDDTSAAAAFTQADAAFTPTDEPPAMASWRGDMAILRGDAGAWIDVAVDYQISVKSQADLDAAAAKVTADLSAAKADAAHVADGK